MSKFERRQKFLRVISVLGGIGALMCIIVFLTQAPEPGQPFNWHILSWLFGAGICGVGSYFCVRKIDLDFIRMYNGEDRP